MSQPDNDHPSVYIPPPMLYASLFLASLVLQRYAPLPNWFVDNPLTPWIGRGLIAAMLCLVLRALLTFLRSRNTVITSKPARSLQTGGIYALSRNPMYLGLLLLYTGLSLLVGNVWTLLLIPLLVLIVTQYIIKREERYLERAFGQAYRSYKQKVRRWL